MYFRTSAFVKWSSDVLLHFIHYVIDYLKWHFSYFIKYHDRMDFTKNRIYMVLDFAFMTAVKQETVSFDGLLSFLTFLTVNCKFPATVTCFLLLFWLMCRHGNNTRKLQTGCILYHGLVEHAAPPQKKTTTHSMQLQHTSKRSMPIHTAQITSFALCR